jgi:SAM-dependent methyltransferase
VGVDTSAPALEQARGRAATRGLTDRVAFERADAAGWRGEGFDAVLCMGATHAFGGPVPTLTAVRRHLRPGGRVLLGEGYWEGTPSPRALTALGAEPGELPGIAALVEQARDAGFEPGHGHLSTAQEWDHYEWCWTGALTDWALTEAGEADRESALELARAHRSQFLDGYRGELGFATIVLMDAR